MKTRKMSPKYKAALISIYRALASELYFIMVEDTGRTFNMNMHTFECIAVSEEEAIGKMLKERPAFKNRKITSIESAGQYEDRLKSEKAIELSIQKE